MQDETQKNRESQLITPSQTESNLVALRQKDQTETAEQLNAAQVRVRELGEEDTSVQEVTQNHGPVKRPPTSLSKPVMVTEGRTTLPTKTSISTGNLGIDSGPCRTRVAERARDKKLLRAA